MLLTAADVVLNEPRDLKDLVAAQRAEREESDSEDQENARDSSDRGLGAAPARVQAAAQPTEQRPAKQVRKRAKSSVLPPHPYSPPLPVPLDPLAQPQQAQPEHDNIMDEGPSSSSAAAAAARQHASQNAASSHNLANDHMQSKGRRAHQAVVVQPQVEVLDAQSRETRMCAWCPNDAVLASG